VAGKTISQTAKDLGTWTFVRDLFMVGGVGGGGVNRAKYLTLIAFALITCGSLML